MTDTPAESAEFLTVLLDDAGLSDEKLSALGLKPPYRRVVLGTELEALSEEDREQGLVSAVASALGVESVKVVRAEDGELVDVLDALRQENRFPRGSAMVIADATGTARASDATTDTDEIQAPSLRTLRATSRALIDAPDIGDPGRQAEVFGKVGPLTVEVPDTALDFPSVAPFEIRACSTRGLSHRHLGIPRQDSFAIAASDDWLVMAVTDGVSQGAHSHVAAELVARGACKLALEPVEGGLSWHEISRRLSARIIEEARHRHLVVPDGDGVEQLGAVRNVMSTTAVLVRVSRSPDAAGEVHGELVLLAGDSGAYRVESQRLSLLIGGKVDDGSPITSSSVQPLPGSVQPMIVEFSLLPGQAILLATDGIGDAVGDGDGEIGCALAQLWVEPPSAAEFFLHTNFRRKSFDDDRTAVVAWYLD